MELAQGVRELGLALSAEAISRLEAYAALLAKWNRVYNLTAIRDPAQIVTHHLLDSLAVLRYVQGPRLADIGAGAGLPGIPLAIADPSLQVTLVESGEKKSAFLTQARTELGLENVAVERRRVQDYHPSFCFNTLICRAFSEISAFLQQSRHLACDGGILLAMKGMNPAMELRDLPSGLRLEGVPRLHVPGLDAERHLVVIRQGASAAVGA